MEYGYEFGTLGFFNGSLESWRIPPWMFMEHGAVFLEMTMAIMTLEACAKDMI